VHYFENFKCFSGAELDLFKPVTLLIGPNASGKSNLIEGVELLAEIAHGRPLYEISDVGRTDGRGCEIRGGLEACPRQGHDTFKMGFVARLTPRAGMEWRSLRYEVAVTVRPTPHVSHESLRVDDNTLVFATRSTDANVSQITYNNFAQGPNKPTVTVRADRSALSQYEDLEGLATKNRRAGDCRYLVDAIRRYLKGSFVFDPNPKLMRSYERIADRPLSRNGANLSAVLHALTVAANGNDGKLDRLLQWIQQVPEEPYASFGFVTTELNDVIFGFRQAANGPLLDARVLSDGTLRCLAVLTALQTAEANSRAIIEEFDNGLHSTRTHVLTQAVTECANQSPLNVLVTTHNPATLDALTTEQLDGVVLCAWDGAEHASRLVRLRDLPRFVELVERGRLGDLVTRKVIDQYLAPGFEEQRTQKALKWLEGLS
jgi:predicted ATPase